MTRAPRARTDFSHRWHRRLRGLGQGSASVHGRAGGPGSRETRVCGDCHFWNPDDVLPWLGECESRGSERYGKARAERDLSADCFRARSLANLDLCWCKKCRETIPVSQAEMHAGHGLFVGTARFTVEEMLELTVAGD